MYPGAAEGAGFVQSQEAQASAPGAPYCSYSSLKGTCQVGAGLSYSACRPTGNSFKLRQGRFRLYNWNFFFPSDWVVRHWNSLCREVMELPGGVQEVFGSRVGWWFSDLGVTVVLLGGWLDWMILKVSLNHDNFVVQVLSWWSICLLIYSP